MSVPKSSARTSHKRPIPTRHAANQQYRPAQRHGARPAAVTIPKATPYRQPASARKTRSHRLDTPLLILIGAPVAFAIITLMIIMIGALFLFGSSSILPGVRVAGVPLGGLSESEAAAALNASWSQNGIILRDEERTFPVDPSVLGISLDTEASIEAAQSYGRSLVAPGNMLRAALGSIDLPPVIRINTAVTEQVLREMASQIEIAPINAGVQIINGSIEPRPAAEGRALDIAGTLSPLERNASQTLSNGELELAMLPVQPQITDPAPIVAAASALLENPLQLRLYDPTSDDTDYWTLIPETWLEWLTASTDSSQPLGVALSLDAPSLRAYLADEQQTLGTDRYIDLDASVQALENALLRGETTADVRVYHNDISYVVQPGETIISIAYDYGIPYPYVQEANDGIDAVSAGQTITLPSRDVMLPEPVVFNKRIVVSISEQHVWVYENGALKWDWVASTGISSSPTWPGIYQIISHEPNAYAANWDLWMPSFMGVYRPIPGSDFTNGFHGFPTRGGSQLLWTNSLGTRVTYGCILLSGENIQTLYQWAETGVVVEIQP